MLDYILKNSKKKGLYKFKSMISDTYEYNNNYNNTHSNERHLLQAFRKGSPTTTTEYMKRIMIVLSVLMEQEVCVIERIKEESNVKLSILFLLSSHILT